MAQREESLDSSELTASLFLAVATFAIFLSSTLVKPVLPVLAEELGGESLEIAGVLMASIVFLSLLQPFTGVLADRYGYLKAIVAGGVLGALTSLLCALASKWQELLVLRALGGLADAVSGPAILALATSISSKRRGLVLGIFRSSQGLSFVIGPILGALLARLLFLRAPFFFDSVLTFIAIVLFLLFCRREYSEGRLERLEYGALGEVVRSGRLLKVACIGFSECFSFTVWSSFLPVYMLSMGMREQEIGLVFSVEALAFSLSNVFVGYLADKVGRKPLAVLGALLTTVSSLAYLYLRSLVQIVVVSLFYGAGCSMIFLLSTVMAADIIPEDKRAALLGAFDAVMDLGLAVGPIATWIFLKSTGLTVSAAFILMACVTGVAALVALSHRER